MPNQKQIRDVLCEEIEIQNIKDGDIIYNPWSHAPVDDWLEAKVTSMPRDKYELRTVAGNEIYSKDKTFWRVVPDTVPDTTSDQK